MKTFIYFSQGEWRTFQTEKLPDKDYNRGCNVCWLDYRSEIAALKAKSLKVGNPEVANDNLWRLVSYKGSTREFEFYRWYWGIELKKEVAILKLPDTSKPIT